MTPEEDSELWEFAVGLAKKVVPEVTCYKFGEGNRLHDYTWSGDPEWTLHFSESPVLLGIHDVAHMLVCSPGRLRFPEFGLGPDPAYGSPAETILSATAAYDEEVLACNIHWAIVTFVLDMDRAAIVEKHLFMDSFPSKKELEYSMMKSYSKFPPNFLDVIASKVKKVSLTETHPRHPRVLAYSTWV